MTRTQRSPDRSTDRLLKGLVQLLPRAHLDEQQHTLVLVLRSALADADRVVDARRELGPLEHAVNFSRAEPYA
jgi:hypothetical protein